MAAVWCESTVRVSGRQSLVALLALGLGSCGGTNISDIDIPEPPDPPVVEGWTSAASMPVRLGLMGAALFRGQIYVAGGQNESFSTQSGVFRYDPATDEWTQLADLPGPRFHLGLVVLNDTLYAVGGEESVADPTATLWAYLPDSDQWVERAQLPEEHGDGAVGVVGGEIVVAAGIRLFPAPPADILHDSVMIYSQANDQWRKGPVIPTRRQSPGFTMVGQRLYVIGGFIADFTLIVGDTEAFDAESQTWEVLVALPLGRLAPTVAAEGGNIHVFGGGDVAEPHPGTIDPHPPLDPTLGRGAADGERAAFVGFELKRHPWERRAARRLRGDLREERRVDQRRAVAVQEAPRHASPLLHLDPQGRLGA